MASKHWSKEEVSILKKAYENYYEEVKKTGKWTKINYGELLKRRSHHAIQEKARRLKLTIKRHGCWPRSKIIKQEYAYYYGRHRKINKHAGLWRFRECQVCGYGFTTFESTFTERRKTRRKHVQDNRLKPLPTWDKHGS